MLVDRRRIIGTFAVLSLVLLRLVIGWHFFGEGTKKLEYDRRDGGLRLAFTSEEFLRQAKGPLAGLYHARVPDEHGWRELLVAPRENVAPGEEEPAEETPYQAWATRIADDWRTTLSEMKSVPGLTDEQQRQAEEAFDTRLTQLDEYLAGEADEIAEYRHEVWRLKNWQASPEARDVPFVQQRIAAKAAETNSRPLVWVGQVRAFEAAYHNDLRGILTAEQRAEAATETALGEALTDSRQQRLRTIDWGVTALTIGVGVCLLLGLFTRVASLAGALFLLSVIASQPPWLYDAAPTMPQVIELAGLLVLAGTGAGRWAGLDFFTYALFNRFRRNQ